MISLNNSKSTIDCDSAKCIRISGFKYFPDIGICQLTIERNVVRPRLILKSDKKISGPFC